MILAVGKRLRRRHHDAFARVNAQGIDVLHITDGNTVVVFIANNLVFDLFPAAEVFFDQDLRGIGKCFSRAIHQLFFIFADPTAQSTQGIGDT